MFYFILLQTKLDFLANIYLFNVCNKTSRKRCEICSKLTIKIREWHHWCRRSGVYIVSFEYISHIFPVFILMTFLFKESNRVFTLTHFIPPLFFLYPLKTSEEHRFSDVSRGYKKSELDTVILLTFKNIFLEMYFD